MLVDIVRDDISVRDDTPTSVGVFHVGDGGIRDLRLQIVDALVLVVHRGCNLGQMKGKGRICGSKLESIERDIVRHGGRIYRELLVDVQLSVD